MLHGSEAQSAAVQTDEEFMRTQVEASLIVDELGMIPGWINEGVAGQVAVYQEAVSKVPQSA
jgi:hypothetical protein